MPLAAASLLVAGLGLASPPGQPVGYLVDPAPAAAAMANPSGRVAYTPDRPAEAPTARPYVPREGDLIFFDDQSELWRFLYKLGGTAPPFHVGIVVKKPDGSMAILESGPDDTLHVYVLEADRRLRTFKGILQVRCCKKELTPEESAKLTAFAMEQEGKRYAMWRLLAQGTPFKTRGKYRSKLFGTTYMNRGRWLCAEIVCTGCAIIGTFDPKVIKGTDTYPLDIVDDHLYDLAAVYTPAAYWVPQP